MSSNPVEQKLTELGLSLPVLPPSKGIYHSCLQIEDMLFVSGHIAVEADGTPIRGKAGADVSDEEAIRAARQCGLAMLSSIKRHLGGFDRVKRVVKLLGMINATPDYGNHAVIINGCSELFVQLWGDELGKGVRSAVGMGSLPGNVTVEVEGVFQIHPEPK